MNDFEARVHNDETCGDDTGIHFNYSDCQWGNVRPLLIKRSRGEEVCIVGRSSSQPLGISSVLAQQWYNPYD